MRGLFAGAGATSGVFPLGGDEIGLPKLLPRPVRWRLAHGLISNAVSTRPTCGNLPGAKTRDVTLTAIWTRWIVHPEHSRRSRGLFLRVRVARWQSDAFMDLWCCARALWAGPCLHRRAPIALPAQRLALAPGGTDGRTEAPEQGSRSSHENRRSRATICVRRGRRAAADEPWTRKCPSRDLLLELGRTSTVESSYMPIAHIWRQPVDLRPTIAVRPIASSPRARCRPKDAAVRSSRSPIYARTSRRYSCI